MWTYGTDAPLYFRPITTICLIAVNVLVLMHTLVHPQALEQLSLHYGEGLRPIEWVAANFAHAGFGHLLANMLGLWTFGLIVEGKIGWWKMLSITMGIGISQCAIEQAMALGMAQGSSCGASSIVFGLMAISLVWAPKNDVRCLIVFWYRIWFFEVPVWLFCGLFILLDVALAAISGFNWGSELLHLMGATAGAVLGIALLKTGQVDCENWDVFSVLRGKHLKDTELGVHKSTNADLVLNKRRQDRLTSRHELALSQFRQLLAENEPLFAFQAHQKLSQKHADWVLSHADAKSLIDGLLTGKHWVEGSVAMKQFVAQFPGQANEMRIRLAFVLLTQIHQPAEAAQVLSPIHASLLPADQRKVLMELREAIAASK